jgi:hypothetical protein
MLFSELIRVWLRIKKLTSEQLLEIFVQFDRGCFAIHHHLPSMNCTSMHCAFDCLEEGKNSCRVPIIARKERKSRS